LINKRNQNYVTLNNKKRIIYSVQMRPPRSMIQAKLINHKRIFLGILPSQYFLMEVLSNIYIIHNLTFR